MEEYYTDNIETVQIFPPGEPLGDPFLVLGDHSSQLLLSFDLFGQEYENLEYTLIHCSADWIPTDLLPNEYLEGYTEAYIRDYDYSINTKQPYIHYRLLFPDENMIITKSGVTIRMHIDTLRPMGRATQGVKLIRIDEGDEIAAISQIEESDEEVEVALEGVEGVEDAAADTNASSSDDASTDVQGESDNTITN